MTRANILIVEDEQIVAMDIQGSLENAGYAVVGLADRGEMALQKAQLLRPDLLMMDIGLKGEMDGIEAAIQIRARFGLPVIFLTAFANQSTLERARLAEPYGYLLKPFDEQELLITIEMALYKHGMEKKLHESEARYRGLVEGMPGIVYSYSNKRGGLYYSAQVREVLGYSPEQLYAEPMLWHDSIHPDDLPRVDQTIREMVPGKSFQIEYRIRAEHGSWLWFDDHSLGSKIDGDEVILEGVALDITRRKQAESAALETRYQLEATLDAIPDLLFELGLDGTYLAYHSPRTELLAAPPEVFLGKTIPEILPAAVAQIVMEALQEAHQQGHSAGKQFELQVPLGKLWFELSISRKPVIPGREPSFIVLTREISRRKALEAAELAQRQLAEALRDSAMTLNSSLKLEEVLDRILENLGTIAACDSSIIFLLEGRQARIARQRLAPGRQTLPHAPGLKFNPADLPILASVIENRQACFISDTQVEPRWAAAHSEKGWIISFACIPILIRDKVAGVINLASATPDFFTRQKSEHLLTFANQAALAIEKAQLFEQTYFLSLTDPLTELKNRRYFFEAAGLEFERTRRYGGTLSVLMLDIDHFKTVNDAYGHSVGDLVLREIAERIKSYIRSVDIAARYGGEEFIILMPETGIHEAYQVAERVRSSVSDQPFVLRGLNFTASLSLGVAEIRPGTRELDDLIKHADMALYAAKAAGRNRVVIHETSEDSKHEQ